MSPVDAHVFAARWCAQWNAQQIPDLRFEVIDVYSGIDTGVINYRNQLGSRVCEVLSFANGFVCEGHATYLSASNPEGASA